MKVSAKREGPNWTRRDVNVADSNQSVKIKLWVEKADYDLNPGELVTCTNVQTNVYNDQKDVLSSMP